MKTFFKKINIPGQFFELDAWSNDRLVVGIDEVGRGCLAGPIVTCSLILKPYANHKYLKDSKLLNRKELLDAFKWLTENSEFTIGILSHNQIDKINIYKATLKTMKKSLCQIIAKTQINPLYILTDNMPIKLNNFNIINFAHGESLSNSIAGASIVAKVTRDNIIENMDLLLPGYNFKKHKGYGTKNHQIALKTCGLSLIHRKTFLNFLKEANKLKLGLKNGEQASIW